MATADQKNQDSLALAQQIIGLESKWLQPFDVEDPFNDHLRLQGFLCQKPDHRYGALAITHVAGQVAPQLILATPKLHYPFGKDGKFHFPPIKKIYVYEKLDGTNVLAYRYCDAQNNWYLTYKLRLYPVLRNSRWGPFLEMWQELLQQYPALPKLVDQNNCAISFEMYGLRNVHLMVYEVDLAVAALFGVNPDATIRPVFQLLLSNVPPAPFIDEITAKDDPIQKYAEIRERLEQRIKPTADDKLVGMEGTVWYVEEPNGRITMWKCKPESVEEIHWAVGINKKAVLATCWNYLETGDVLNYDNLLPLLLEEYELRDIENFRPYIDQCLAQVNQEVEFQQRVLDAYDRLGISIRNDKGAVMRAMSQLFQRNEMQKVYTAIMRNR
ncbi:MAG: hypothetical protein ONB11_06650 [candidate division KSB1 bacterium]|nr:hypothetical protein [candidate division KSB1 bacterium]